MINRTNMQKRILFLFFILTIFFTHTALRAQMNTSLGLKAGGNYSFLAGSDVHGSKSLTAPYGGIIIRLTEADNEWMKYVFQGEVLYSIVGSKSPNDQMTL